MAIENKAIKALKDKLSHLKSGRDLQTPGKIKSDGTKLKEPELPGLKSPRTAAAAPIPGLAKSDDKSNYLKGLFDLQDRSYKQEESFRKSQELKKEEPLRKPFKSDAQRRAMFAAAEGSSTLDIPKKVGKEFISASKGEDVKDLPEKVKKSNKVESYGDAKKWLEKRVIPFEGSLRKMEKNIVPFEEKPRKGKL
jgi:hypothetical protein